MDKPWARCSVMWTWTPHRWFTWALPSCWPEKLWIYPAGFFFHPRCAKQCIIDAFPNPSPYHRDHLFSDPSLPAHDGRRNISRCFPSCSGHKILDSFAGSHFPVLTLLRAAEPGCKTPSSAFCSIPRLSTDPLEMGMVAASSSFAEQLPHFLQHSQGSSEQSSQSRKYCIAPKAPRQGERDREKSPSLTGSAVPVPLLTGCAGLWSQAQFPHKQSSGRLSSSPGRVCGSAFRDEPP